MMCLSAPFSPAQVTAKNVLVIFSYFNRAPNPMLDLLESTARARVPGKINFYVAYPEFRRVGDKAFQESQAETIRRQYGEVKLDLVIVVSDPAFSFVLQYRSKMFPGVPIVVTGIGSARFGEQKYSGLTAVVADIGIRETIDLALRLQPDTSNFAVIADDTDTLWWGVAHSELLRHQNHSELLRHQNKVKEIDIVGAPSAEMLERVAALPPHTVVLFQMFASESAQPAVGVYDVLDAAAQQLPVYSAWPLLVLGHRGVGGEYLDSSGEGRLTGKIVVRVLKGEPPDSIPVVHFSDLQVRVDWRELHRWHIPESALPAGSVVLYRPPSIWESYRRYVIAVVGVMFALLVLVIGLLWERARKRKAEARLRESEKRFRVMAETTPTLVWMCDAQGKITYLNERRLAFTGPDPKAGYGDTWIEYVHPDDVRNVKDAMSHGLKDRQSFSREYRLRRSDGVYRWMFDVASQRLNGDGSFAGFIGSAIDVTDQKLAQQALEKVSGQLIEAQENERRRIARDLHDDICQRLALLSMELDQANRGVNDSTDATKYRLKEIRQHCSEIAGDVQSLSHELHSSRLDYLGIVAAIGGFCHEFSKQHEVSIEFTDRDVPADLPREISLCLFRVTQEALHNAVKYSGVNEYQVELTATAEEIQLGVSDAGLGFDAEVAKGNRGLGLVSMQERVHLVQAASMWNHNRGREQKSSQWCRSRARASNPSERDLLSSRRT
jgi:PAS domain S-box-containing protein